MDGREGVDQAAVVSLLLRVMLLPPPKAIKRRLLSVCLSVCEQDYRYAKFSQAMSTKHCKIVDNCYGKNK